MAVPFLKVKDTGELLTDNILQYSYWQTPHGMAELTPISGGSYLQNTTAGTLRMGVTLRFYANSATSPLDNYFYMMELKRADAQTLYRFQDVQGFVRDVQIAKITGWDEATSIVDMRDVDTPTKDFIAVGAELVVPGYLPATLGL